MDTINLDIDIHLTRTHLTLAPAKKPHKYCLIFFHGIGMPVQKFYSVFLSDNVINLLQDFKIIIPQGPIRPMEIFGGKEGHSYHRRGEDNFKEATETYKPIVLKELEALDNDPSRMFLGGFSQGSALSLNIALTLGLKFGGLVLLGGWMSEYTKLPEDKEIPDFLAIHGAKDAMVSVEHSKTTMKPILERPNATYIVLDDMQHDLYSEEAKKLLYDFIRERTRKD